jgi:hypothetical protein
MKELLLTSFPTTKEQQELVANRWAEQAINGEVNPLDAEVYIASIENLVKCYRANKELREHLVDIVEQEGGKVKVGNTTISVSETSVTYEYEQSKKWRDLDRQIEELTARRKSIETALKNATEDTPFDDGDFNKICNCPKTSKKTIKVTIEKK